MSIGIDLDLFDYDTYFALTARLRSGRALVRFVDLATGSWPDRFLILRHDVDYSPAAALELARREAERGLRATYFILMQTFYYNVLAPEWASFPGQLAALGHEVGLHYDTRSLESFSLGRARAILRSQATLLGDLAGSGVTTIAPHQPTLGPSDRFRTLSGFTNAMDATYCGEIHYVSDSCRAFRDEAVHVLLNETPARLQVGLHPINWGDSNRGREDIFGDIHLHLSRFVLQQGVMLVEEIRRHEGVREHQKRKGGVD